MSYVTVYTQASSQYLLDRSTWNFVPYDNMARPCEVDIPGYLWWFPKELGNKVANEKGAMLAEQRSMLTKRQTVKLNRLDIKMMRNDSLVTVDYFDLKSARFVKIIVDYCYSLANKKHQGQNVKSVIGINYHISVNEKERSEFTQTDPYYMRECEFRYVSYLGHKEVGGQRLSFGLSNQPYSVVFKGKILDGHSYAWLCGTWGILLGDDFTFDSLILLKGVESHALFVDKVIHTVNPYVVKVMMLA